MDLLVGVVLPVQEQEKSGLVFQVAPSPTWEVVPQLEKLVLA